MEGIEPKPSKLTYTGLGIVRGYSAQKDMVPNPEAFNTPTTKWVCAELHWTTGFEPLVFESAAAAKSAADKLGIPFVDKMAARRR